MRHSIFHFQTLAVGALLILIHSSLSQAMGRSPGSGYRTNRVITPQMAVSPVRLPASGSAATATGADSVGGKAPTPEPVKCDEGDGSENVKITHYFSGGNAGSVEGTSHGLGTQSLPVIPCFSVACTPGKVGQIVKIPQLAGLKCNDSSPLGKAEDLWSGKVTEAIYKKKKFKISKQNLEKMAVAQKHLECSGGVCTNKTGEFRCDDTGSMTRNHYDIYTGMCKFQRGDSCITDIAQGDKGELPANLSKPHPNSPEALIGGKTETKNGQHYAKQCAKGQGSSVAMNARRFK